MAEKFVVIGASSFYGRNFMELVKKKGDFALPMSLRDWSPPWLMDVQPDYVINFAAANIVPDSWENPLDYCRINVSEHTLLFDVLRDGDWLKRFIQVSTPEVYGSTEGWVDETFNDWQPTTPYAVTRAAGDMMLKAFVKAYRFPALITRTANIYGPGQAPNRIIPATLKAIREGTKLPLQGKGNSRRSFIHVKDACEATYMLAKKGDIGHTYHISTNRDVAITELVKMICKIKGKRFEDVVEQAPERLGKDFAYYLNSDKIRRMGWTDKISLERGLQECASLI